MGPPSGPEHSLILKLLGSSEPRACQPPPLQVWAWPLLSVASPVWLPRGVVGCPCLASARGTCPQVSFLTFQRAGFLGHPGGGGGEVLRCWAQVGRWGARLLAHMTLMFCGILWCGWGVGRVAAQERRVCAPREEAAESGVLIPVAAAALPRRSARWAVWGLALRDECAAGTGWASCRRTHPPALQSGGSQLPLAQVGI